MSDIIVQVSDVLEGHQTGFVAPAAPESVVQVAGKTSTGGTTFFTLPQTPTPGNLVVVCQDSGAFGFNTVIDGVGNVYSPTASTPSAVGIGIWYLRVPPAGASNVLQIDVNGPCQLWAIEFRSNYGGEFIYDQDAAASGGPSTSIDGPSLTPSAANAILVACTQCGDAVLTANAPWTGIETIRNGDWSEYIINAPASARAVDFTQTNFTWNTIAASFIPGSSALDPNTIAWIAQVVQHGGTVSSPRAALVDTLIRGLRTDGLLPKLGPVWLTAAENSTSAETDIMMGLRATAVGAPTFTVDRGYSGDGGAPGAYLDTTVLGIELLWSLNAASLFGWSLSSGVIASGLLGTAGAAPFAFLEPRFTGGLFTAALNDGGGDSGIASSDGSGFSAAVRTNSTTIEKYTNGSSIGSSTVSSTSIPTGNLRLVSNGTVSYNGQVACAGFAGLLSATDVQNLYNRLRTYMTAVGVP